MKKNYLFVLFSIITLFSCKKHVCMAVAQDITTATKTSVDRFSAAVGHLMVRNTTNGLPAANAPMNMWMFSHLLLQD